MATQVLEASVTTVKPTPVLTITEYFARREEEDKKLTAQRQTQIDQLGQEREKADSVGQSLDKERAKKVKLQQQMQAEGVDTAALDGKISEIDAQITMAKGKAAELQHQISELLPIEPRDWAHARGLAKLVQQYCKATYVVTSARDVYAHLPVKCESDAAGHPSQVTIDLGGTTRVVAIRGAETRFVRGYCPEDLLWFATAMRNSPLAEPEDSYGSRERWYAILDLSSGEMLVSRRFMERYASEAEESDCPDFVTSLEDHVDAQLAGVKEVNVADTTNHNSLTAHIASVVEQATTSTSWFTRQEQCLTSTEIHKQIQAEWHALAVCAWTKDVTDQYALLKYHVENGEKARFWSSPFAHHFGFRLRTRDHTWLVGRLYIDPTASSPEKPVPPVFHAFKMRNREHRAMQVGRMYMITWTD